VAEKFSTLIDPQQKLVFDDFTEELTNYENVMYHKNETKDQETKVEIEPIPTIAPKKEKVLDPDAPLFGNESSEDDSEEIHNENDETESLQSLDTEEMIREKIPPPKYAKQILEMLSVGQEDQDHVAKLESVIKYAKSVITLRQSDLNEYSSQIAKRLLYCSEDYQIENFEKSKHEILVALVVNSTEFVVK
jgi:hypothetical protein